MRLLKISGLCGILCPVIAIICIMLAISYAPWFSWTENCLSDLAGMRGEIPLWAARGAPSILFNTGIITVGILAIVFGLGLRKSFQLGTCLGHLGTLVFILGAFALFFIGIFPETIGTLHTYASISFFFLTPLSMFLIGVSIIKSADRVLGLSTVAFGIIGVCPFLIPWSWKGCAIPELIAIIPMIVFALVFGIKLFRQNKSRIKFYFFM